jgi:sugar phosphate permease
LEGIKVKDNPVGGNSTNVLSSDTSIPHSTGNVRWRIPGFLFVGAVISYFDRANLAIANPVIAKEFGLDPAMMGILLSAFLWPYAISCLPAGWLVDRFGPKRLLGIAVGAWSIVTLLTGFVSRFNLFYGLRVLLGVAEAPFFPVGAKICKRWFPANERGRAMSILHTGPQVANAIAPPLLTIFMVTLGWRAMFIVLGIAGLVFATAWHLFYKDPLEHKSLSREEYEYISGGHEEGDEGGTLPWLKLFKQQSTIAMIVGNFGLIYLHWTYWTWLPGYLVQGRGLSIVKTGWVAMIPYVAGIVGVPLGGYISDYLIRRGYKPITARKVPILAGAILTSILVAPVAYVESTVLSVGLLTVANFTAMLVPGVVWTLATDVAPKKVVASLGAIQNSGGYLGATLAPIVTGVIVHATGSFNLVFVVCAALSIVSAISYGFFLKKPIQLESSDMPSLRNCGT